MCGLPFSGKTSLAKKIAEHTRFKLVGFDALWLENEKNIPKTRDGVKGWKYIRALAKDKIHELLKQNASVIYDDINARKEHREDLRNVAKTCKAHVIVVYLDTSFDEILKRRKANISRQERHDVEPKNFRKAVLQFEEPTEDEDVLIYDQKIPLDEWIEKNF